MFLAGLRSLVAHRFRLALSTFAITLAVAFVSGSLVFTNLLGAALTNIVKGTLADVNVVPSGTYQPDTTTESRPDKRLSSVNLTAVSSVPGVASVTGVITAVNAYPVDSAGRLIGSPGAQATATSWFQAPAAEGGRGIVLRSGRPPQANDEVVVDPETLKKSGLGLGDEIGISITGQPEIKKRLVGTADWGDSGGNAGSTHMFFSTAEAQQLFLKGEDAFTTGWVVAKAGVDVEQLSTRVSKVLPKGYEAASSKVASEATGERINSSLGFLNTFLLIFAGIAVLVASFLIVNTFNILVAQRSRELALLRAIGAKRRQIRVNVLFEASLVGLVASTLGLFGGLGLGQVIRASFGSFGFNLGTVPLSLPFSAVAASFGVGLLVTVVAAYVPAVRAGRLPPVVAMTGDVGSTDKGFGLPGWLGALALPIGVGTAVGAVVSDLAIKWWLVGAGAVLALVGATLAIPLIGRPVVRTVGWLAGFRQGELAKLAERNAVRQPRRLAATASALMIGLSLVTTIAVLGESTQRSLESGVRETLRGDLQVSDITTRPFSPAVGDQLAKLQGVESVHRMKAAAISIGGSREMVIGESQADFDQVVAQKLESGRPAAEKGEALVNRKKAESMGWQIGQELDLTSQSGVATRVRVVGTYSDPVGPGLGSLIVTLEDFAQLVPPNTDSMVVLNVLPGQDVSVIRTAAEKNITDATTIVVTNVDEWAKLQIDRVSTVLGLLYALLGLALVIAVLGIVNTLVLAVMERTREIGLLRAVGLTRKQLRRMIGLEAVMITTVGSAMGIALGIGFGVVIRRGASADGLTELGIPWLQILAFLVVAILIGMSAALFPARRAARQDVLAAISTE